MDILETLLGSMQEGAVGRAAQQLGIGSTDSSALVKKLVPMLAGGIEQSAAGSDGLGRLAAALGNGNHQRYLDNPAELEQDAATNDGNAILGHILGSKDVSRRVAAEASAETGIDVATVKKFLPLIAAASMGALSKQTEGGASLARSDTDGGLGLLSSLLGSSAAQSTAGKLFSLGKKLF
ncbi:MAG: DUF937 domain-containing protein [Gammaproteobacteria bacterium]|nr:DUF937 domain-containing protein [Gammaproteobacteria bacterium]